MSLTIILQLAAAALSVAAQSAPPSSPHFFSATHRHHISPLDYYMDSPEMVNYYTLAQQRNVPARAARLETLEPDSEVELVPGVQQPPPQPLQPPQPPVAGNIPGLVPGQRVFIVHMPVPGYRPGTIGGYQPVYIVAAAPQGHYASGYQNTLLVDPSLQVVSPLQLRASPPAPAAPLAPPVPVAPSAQPEPPVLLGTPLGYNSVNFVYNPKNYRGVASLPGLGEPVRVRPGTPPPPAYISSDREVATESEARRAGHKAGHRAGHRTGHKTGHNTEHEAAQSGSEETTESVEERHEAVDASM